MIGQGIGGLVIRVPQSTGFVVDPTGRVAVSVYSSGATGRLVPDDVIGMIRYLRDHAQTASA